MTRRIIIASVMLAAVVASGQDANWHLLFTNSPSSVWLWSEQAGTNAADSVSNRHAVLTGSVTWTTRPSNAYAITTFATNGYAKASDTFKDIYALPTDASDAGSWSFGTWVLITNSANCVLAGAGGGGDHYGDGGHSFVMSWETSLQRVRMTVRTAASNSTSVLSPNNTANFVGEGWQFVAYSYKRSSAKYDMWINNSRVSTQKTGMGGTFWNTNGSPSIVFGNRAITSPYDASPASIGQTFFAVNVYIDPEAMTNIYWHSSTNYISPSPVADGVRFSTQQQIYNLITRGSIQ